MLAINYKHILSDIYSGIYPSLSPHLFKVSKRTYTLWFNRNRVTYIKNDRILKIFYISSYSREIISSSNNKEIFSDIYSGIYFRGINVPSLFFIALTGQSEGTFFQKVAVVKIIVAFGYTLLAFSSAS